MRGQLGADADGNSLWHEGAVRPEAGVADPRWIVRKGSEHEGLKGLLRPIWCQPMFFIWVRGGQQVGGGEGSLEASQQVTDNWLLPEAPQGMHRGVSSFRGAGTAGD